MPSSVLAVKGLCRFTAMAGDLDRRFTPAPTGRQGIEGHSLIAARRGPDYRAEVALDATHGALRVRGRADGYLASEHRLEEFKTHRGPVDRIPENHRALHRAQLQTYGAMLCARESIDALTLVLVYLDIDAQTETLFEEHWTAERLATEFHRRCEAFASWAQREVAHRTRRDASLREMMFPYAALHAGQRVLAEAVYRAAASCGKLLAEAPTGVGKTLGTLFPLLKAMAADKIDKIYYLTAKSTGRALALEALAALKRTNPRLSLRVLDLVAREKSCAYPDRQCQGQSCPLARGFYDRLPAARAAAAELEVLDRTALRAVADAHGVCAYYLGQEMVRWVDVVVADYNHYFDGTALLPALLRENDWRVGVLVDEAHNLLPRAREMYSSSLTEDCVRASLRAAPTPLRPLLARVAGAWSCTIAELPRSYAAVDELPQSLLDAMRDAAGPLSEWSVTQTEPLPDPVLTYHFAALQFLRLVDSLGAHSLLEWTPGQHSVDRRLGVRNLVPAPFLAARFAAATTTALFSATLSPQAYYREMFGLQDDCRGVVVDSPFRSEQLTVRIVADVSTRFRHRARSLGAIVELVARQFRAVPGNYLLFAGGFDYLGQVAARLAADHPDIPVWTQAAEMSEPERAAFTAQFREDGAGIGLAVLGGAFAEGIDLPGSRLIGAFVLTLGLPTLDAANEETRRRFEQRGWDGFDYTYLYPGLQRVVQAAGRVIRSAEDRGILYLVDDRYTRPEVAALLPPWWAVTRVTLSPPDRSIRRMARSS